MSWQVPGYRHRMHLGDGATGRVVLAVREETGELAVIRYMATTSVSTDVIRDEVDQMAVLDAHLFVRVRDVVEQDGNVALISDPVSGVALRAMVRDHGALPAEAALVIYRDTLTGLSLAHASGIVHGDYRPENVLVVASGAVVMTDALAYGWTAREVTLGTGVYFAPELWRGGAASAAADVYAATVTLYESLVGEPPYWEETQLAALRHQHEQGAVPQGEVDPELREIIRGGLAKDPGERYDAAALLELVEVGAAATHGRDWVRRGREQLGERVGLMAVPFGGVDGVTEVAVGRETELVELDDYYADQAAEVAADGTVVTAAEEIVTLAVIEEGSGGAGELYEEELTEEEEAAVAEIEALIGAVPAQRHTPEEVVGASAAAVEAALAAGAHRAGVVDVVRDESAHSLTVTETVEVVTVVAQARYGAGATSVASVAVDAATRSGARTAEVVDVSIVEESESVTVTETVTVVTVIERRRRDGLVAGAVLGAGAVAAGAVLVEEGAEGAAVGYVEGETEEIALAGAASGGPVAEDVTVVVEEDVVVAGTAAGGLVPEQVTVVDEEVVLADVAVGDAVAEEDVVLAGAAAGGAVAAEEITEVDEIAVARRSDDTVIIPAVVGGAAAGTLIGEEITEVDAGYAEVDEVDGGYVEVDAEYVEVDEEALVAGVADETVIIPAVVGGVAEGVLAGEEISEVDAGFVEVDEFAEIDEFAEVDEELVAVGTAAAGLAGEELVREDEIDEEIVLAGAAAGGLAVGEITDVDQTETAIIPVVAGGDSETAVIPVVVGSAAGGTTGSAGQATGVDDSETAVIPVAVGAAAGGVLADEGGGLGGGVRRHHAGGGTAGGAVAGGEVAGGGVGLTERGRGWVRRHPWFSGFIVLIIIAACIFGGILVGGGFDDSHNAGPTLPSQSPTPTAPQGNTNGTPTPSGAPGSFPSGGPSGQPSGIPSGQPSGVPSGQPSGSPSGSPGQPGTPTPTPTPTHKPKPSPSPSNPCAPPTHHGAPPTGGAGGYGIVMPALRC